MRLLRRAQPTDGAADIQARPPVVARGSAWAAAWVLAPTAVRGGIDPAAGPAFACLGLCLLGEAHGVARWQGRSGQVLVMSGRPWRRSFSFVPHDRVAVRGDGDRAS